MSDNLVSVEVRPSLELSPIAALTMALDGAADRGQPLTPAVILECMPDGWGLCDTCSVGALAAELLEALEPLGELQGYRIQTGPAKGDVVEPLPVCEVRSCTDYGRRHVGACLDDPYSVQCRKSPGCDGRDGHPFDCA